MRRGIALTALLAVGLLWLGYNRMGNEAETPPSPPVDEVVGVSSQKVDAATIVVTVLSPLRHPVDKALVSTDNGTARTTEQGVARVALGSRLSVSHPKWGAIRPRLRPRQAAITVVFRASCSVGGRLSRSGGTSDRVFLVEVEPLQLGSEVRFCFDCDMLSCFFPIHE